jgi:uncharacterized membrane protein
VSGHSQDNNGDQPSTGQRLAEHVAAFVGSWAFISAQAAVMALWVLVNTLTFTGVLHFDEYPFVFLNLAMSAEAAFTGPILLIAANVGAMRDHKQSDRIEHLSAQNEALAEQNRQLVEQMVSLERTVDEHVAASIRAHTIEIRQVYALMREVHTAVTGKPAPDSADSLIEESEDASAVAVPDAAAAPAKGDESTRKPPRRRGRQTSG